MPGFILSVESNNRVWYLIGTIFFVLIGVGMAIGGFGSGTAGLGIVGIVVALASGVLMIDAIMNLSD